MAWELLARVVIIGFLSTSFVTCQSDEPQSIQPENYDPTTHPNWKLFDTEKCGFSSADRIVGGRTAALGSFPWLARLGYFTKSVFGKKSILPVFRCGGTVITNRYVITAAHCSLHDPNLTLELVRLGEFDVNTDPDCDRRGHCADTMVDYELEEIISHMTYGKPAFKNDISLLRTVKKIAFTMYVRPICMTMSTLLTKDFVGETAEVAGWGVVDPVTRVSSANLQVLRVPIVDLDKCHDRFKAYAVLGDTQMCAGGMTDQDSCSGDSGGALMKIESVDDYPPRYYIIGIVSFGARDCAIDDVPAVYTSMAHFMLWMLDHMEP